MGRIRKRLCGQVHIVEIDRVVVGHFGGNSTAGQSKNEDGCLLWIDEEKDWEFAILLDAHDTAESAQLVVSEIYQQKETIAEIMALECESAFQQINDLILKTFNGQSFQSACRTIKGETACLFVIRKENFLSWFSVGDCILHLHHPELSGLGEYQQNHRSFFEWVGRESTFNKSVPCYSTGTKELRKGTNHIFLTTDGLTDCPGTEFERPEIIFSAFNGVTNLMGVEKLLSTIRENNVRDSTTILSWRIPNTYEATWPSN
ncbi:protein phosphatase 2C domain-containing protein [Bacillus sp. SCS-153A]|uniref:protein phosphatase 2C domain-containing protein n=1 Tax=Rossellomorea sedimentorum TaxID=3115294 RepID=UPI00390677CD